jgi:HPt (histidine-containing phosphotransfer) domain-containing protein
LICGTEQEITAAIKVKENQNTSYDLSIIKEMEDDSYTSDILKQFLDTTPVMIQQLEDALIAKDYQQLFFTAHKLKSGLGLLQVKDMLADCTEIEGITRNNKECNEKEHDQIMRFLQNMRKQYQSLQPALEKELKQVAAVY